MELLTWTELPGLDGRIIFVARRCSRCFDLIDFPGGQDGVYYLDDRTTMTRTPRPYLCSDNGVWSPHQTIRRWFWYRGSSTTSSPMWFLP
ncbi:hypothetical protein BRADI_2g15988v3 [Brachypodium distachyon]|uniref:DUF295 domain-containing protein n=1 Tax=Brachypodium distachyon TaxID=15368 RepID=A0A2K2D8T7_BRADI|nr:hypothetical protein BRADI_2g15988v3 [Brachypodium distachyon]